MSARKLLRWACSFVASEVTVENIVSREVYCGEKTLLCSIVLTNADEVFKDYHNEIKVSLEHGSDFENSKCEISIEEDRRNLWVYCVAKRAARAIVELDLGKWYTFKGISDFSVLFRPSCPTKLTSTIICGDSNHDKHKEAYKGKHLKLNVRLLDQFENEITIPPSTLSLQQESGPQSGLHYDVIATNDSSLTIEYYFSQKGTYDLRLKYQDDEGLNIRQSSFPINIKDAPVDLQSSTITWLPTYKDIQEQPVFDDDKNFLCRIQLIDVLGKNYEGAVNCSNVTVNYEGTEIHGISATQSGDDAYLNVTVPLKGNLIKEWDFEPTFWFFLDGIKVSRPLVLSTFDGLKEFDEERCTIRKESIVCYGLKRKDIIGQDYSNLNNIKRVCELEDDPRVVEYGEEFEDNDQKDEDERIVTVVTLMGLHGESSKRKTKVCHELLLHLFKALYNRERASKADQNREYWKEMATKNYNRIHDGENIDDYRPTFCSKIKGKYAKLMKRYNVTACEEIFQFFNMGRNQSEIDLHGLLVGDEKKLKDYERQLLGKGRMRKEEVKRKINEEREHSDEAIRKLKDRLESYTIEKAREDEEPWLEIIVGAGHHSKIKDRQNVRPKVEKFLREENRKFSPVNKGALVITFEKYSGQEPCFGEYYCKECGSRWRNSNSWIDKWQACFKCHNEKQKLVKCFPLKQRLIRKRLYYRPTGAARTSEYIPQHVEELCQKCRELGRVCANR